MLCILFVYVIRVLDGLEDDHGDISGLVGYLNIHSIPVNADYTTDALYGFRFVYLTSSMFPMCR